MDQAKAKMNEELIAAIDADSAASSFRVHERPRFPLGIVRRKPARPVEVKKAIGRANTRGWRVRNDMEGRPETADIGRALLVALVMSDGFEHHLEHEDLLIVAVALEMLEMGGFPRAKTKDAMRRYKQRVETGRVNLREADPSASFKDYLRKAEERAAAEGFKRKSA